MSRNKNLAKQLIPKEHGTWAMWVVPLIIGVIAAGRITLASVLIFGVSLFAFACRTALASALRLRKLNKPVMRKCLVAALVELALIAGLAFPLLIQGNHAIALIGLIAVALLVTDLRWINKRSERDLLSQLVGVAGFALTAPAAYIATTGAWSLQAGILWAISFAYFSGSVFFVKLRLARLARGRNANGTDAHYARLALVYVFLVVICGALFSSLAWMPPWLLLAFLPWICHLFWEAIHLRSDKNINRVGWMLVAHSLYFTTLVSLIFVFN
ncbi:MAG: YwiC-like family protein [bacterium]